MQIIRLKELATLIDKKIILLDAKFTTLYGLFLD